MAFIVVRNKTEIGQHACYGPAEAIAKVSPGSEVIYEGIRGQCVVVYPLEPLKAAEAR